MGGKVELDEFHWLLSAHIRERVYYEYCRYKNNKDIEDIGIRQGKQESYQLYANMLGISYEDVRKCIKIGREVPQRPCSEILRDMGLREEAYCYMEDQPVLVETIRYVAE